ncbi:O-antigen ligase family protein [Pseudarthrobacter sp. fls2-241-R2A-127]|uniref:O-antigen ligase family protein n=1 Tax=Pseudarthrobacter sp. fls2-241-R2A-127 TaxID=3040303 RepID=UPI002557008E|nr:O-antigen ligase family protein [Pseudarthrobacter sp. fls2-241-R2A-127]
MDFAGVFGALLGIGLLIGGAVVVWHVHNWPVLGWILIAYGVLTNSDATPTPVVSIGNIHVFQEDAISALLLAVTILSVRTVWQNLGQRALIPLLMLAVLVVNLAIGFKSFGMPAIVEFRPFFYFFACLAWGLSLDWAGESAKKHARYFLYICGWGLVAIAALNIAKHGIASSSDMYIDPEGTYHTLRPVVASQAAVLTVAGLYALYEWGRVRGAKLFLSGIAFSGVVIVAQHRSVWIAFAAGILVLGLRAASAIRWRIALLAIFSSFGILILALSGALTTVMDSFAASIDAVTATNSTLTDRTSGWDSLVSDSLSRGPAAVLFGQPFGTGYLRIGPNGLPQTYAPHNWYVSIYLRTGIVGALSFSSILLGALVRLAKQRSIWAGVMACIAVFALAYTVQWFIAPLIAAAIAISNTQSAAAVEVKAPKKLRPVSEAYRHFPQKV